ncbi:synthase [Musa troglodytarum]|uniref:Synthase n=1 Tax=Musa troglodytarum TaxID=320322 RepID=A0A9E7LCV0_9LILI|nr:synthase [Musa troglodytarum]
MLDEFEEKAYGGGSQSLALAALANSFLVCGSGIPVVKNFAHRPVYVLIKVINDDEQENHVIFMYPIMGWVCEVHGAVAPSWTSVM